MTDKVLGQRVKRLEIKLDQSIEQDHERLTRLEDVLADFIKSNQDGFAKSQQEMVEFRQEMAASRQHSDAEFAKFQQQMAASRQHSDAEFAKSQQQMAASRQHSDAEFAKSQQQMAESQKRNDAEFAKFQQQMAESQKRNDAGFAKLRQDMGYLSHRLGDLVEDLVAPSLPEVLRDVVECTDTQNAMLTVRIRRRHPSQPGKMLEIDAIADCGNYVLFNETKNQLTPEKVTAFLDKLGIIREYFPEYQHYTILGSVSAPAVAASLIEYASRQGLFVLGANEGLMTLQNAPGFTWRAF